MQQIRCVKRDVWNGWQARQAQNSGKVDDAIDGRLVTNPVIDLDALGLLDGGTSGKPAERDIRTRRDGSDEYAEAGAFGATNHVLQPGDHRLGFDAGTQIIGALENDHALHA